MNDLIAYPGHAILGMKNQYGDFEGDIFIPRNARSLASEGRLGQVLSLTQYMEGEESLVFVKGILRARKAYLKNAMFADLLGKFVVCRNARLIYGELYDVRLEFIGSVVPEDALPGEDDLGRCKRCPSTGEANILLGPDGYCPNCGFNKYDEHKSEEAITVDEWEVDEYVRNPAEVRHFMRTGGKRINSRMMSFPGQKKMDFSEGVSVDDELDWFMEAQKR